MTDLAEFRVRTQADVVVAEIIGEIDLSNAGQMEDVIVGSVPNTALGLVVDMTATTYIDSSGIRLLLALAGRARTRGQVVVVVTPGGSRVRRVLAVAGADDALEVHGTTESARLHISSTFGGSM